MPPIKGPARGASSYGFRFRMRFDELNVDEDAFQTLIRYMSVQKLRTPKGLAPSNAALVEKAVKIVTALDAVPASPAEARRILGLPLKQSSGGSI